ncbi:hypothetical protein FZEAL_8332 [Fusarium zealandicum]|uniref:Uncharacterized protein n=1 Tax=Fusarium zealandicum TaxID=1053134 RepID=A0A8H4UEK8_9HYPO|nr:hypothetical protein FZEAL_8332 [Fusarium zealandicum]
MSMLLASSRASDPDLAMAIHVVFDLEDSFLQPLARSQDNKSKSWHLHPGLGERRFPSSPTSLIDDEDDWSGVTDAASRRRLQNRLNVRAYLLFAGRRRALESQAKATDFTATISGTIKREPEIPCWVENEQVIRLLPASAASAINRSQTPLIPQRSTSIVPTKSSQKGVAFPLSSDHLIILLQFNVLRASLANRELILPLGSSPVAECSAAAKYVLPYPSTPGVVPPSLLPTALQGKIPHEGWLDIIPHPVWRDNVLLALGHFDEDDVWSDIMGGLFEGFPESEIEHRGVIAWSPPWDPSGWELSEGFVRKWTWMFRGCEDLLATTNKYRQSRGDKPIVLEIL